MPGVRCLPALLASLSSAAIAQPPGWREVAPILRAHCAECHGERVQRKSLRLDVPAGVARGGRGGPVVVPGDSGRSPLVLHVLGTPGRRRMPADGPPLPAAAIGTLRDWIDAGAEGLDAGGDADLRLWSRRPIRRPALPAGAAGREIDALVESACASRGLQVAPPAAPGPWLRRVSLDLCGLPPTIDELDAYAADRAPGAAERVVDRLLGSRHFGERWAAWWLDLARYADTKGYEKDERRSIWRYRDWVIDAFNRNLPFDRFTIEQLAGDLVAAPSEEQRIATAFHRNTMTNDEGGTDDEEFRVAAVIDRVNTTLQVWMGTTVGCAQCHDHEYDPVSQREYYELLAFFDQTEDDDHPSDRPLLEAPTGEQRRELETLRAEQARLRREQEEWTSAREEAFAAWLARQEAVAADCAAAAFAPPLPAAAVAALARPAASREPADLEALRAAWREAAPEMAEVRDALARLASRLAAFPVPTVPVLRERPSERSRTTRILRRGSFLDPGAAVAPGVPATFHPFPAGAPRNRLGLARWLVAPDNPLTARVLVNRVWEQLFGRGFVDTPEDFGAAGEPPAHPELLDWMAAEFFGSGYDFKGLLRRIVLSATYGRAADGPGRWARDPANRWLARGPRVRLSAEAVRDQALAVSGLLDARTHGPSVMPYQPDGVWSIIYSNDQWRTAEHGDRHRRALYTFWRRTSPYPAMVTFDAPSREFCVVRRTLTNTPLQALVTLNDPAFVEMARALGRRLQRRGEVGAGLVLGFRLCTGRHPAEAELRRLRELFDAELAAAGTDAAGHDRAWTAVGSVLLNLDETLTKG